MALEKAFPGGRARGPARGAPAVPPLRALAQEWPDGFPGHLVLGLPSHRPPSSSPWASEEARKGSDNPGGGNSLHSVTGTG